MRLVSIVGDSISTYEGFVPPGYSVYYNRQMQRVNGLNDVYDTWWGKLNRTIGAYLCVNNSYSGSKVTGDGFPAASSRIRTSGLHTAAYLPELILIYIGFNDFGNGVAVFREESRETSDEAHACFEDAYSRMLSDIKRNYPKAKIVCATLARSAIRNNGGWAFPECFAGKAFEDYNRAIRAACNENSCALADIGAMDFRYETLDGAHPTKNGHDILYQAWLCGLSELGII